MNIMLSFIFVLVMSPIWPLGPNPLVGDPFIIVNKQLNQLAFINNSVIQGIYPVATGATSELTPEGMFNVVIKAVNPYFRRKNIMGGSPDNPLGSRWIGFDAEGTDGRIYGVHGTNNPSSIGKYISNGCIRMNNHDVEKLFAQIPIGTKILVTNTNKSFSEIGMAYGALPFHHPSERPKAKMLSIKAHFSFLIFSICGLKP